jgi:Pyruvate/2-oxoacid:ferredoxin oxidoreductase gamma subunit
MNDWPEYGELMKQASMTADIYLGEAVERIDRILGEGYAEKNPVLVAAFIQACSMDFVSASVQKTLQETVRYFLENQNADPL